MSRSRFGKGREAANDDIVNDAPGVQDDASFRLLQDARQGGRLEISVDGAWLCDGRPILQPEMVSFLGGMLEHQGGGAYRLDLPSGELPVLVQDAPFVGEQLFIAGCCSPDQTLSIRTNLDEITTIDRDHPLRVVFEPDPVSGRPGPGARCYVTVRPGLEARLLPHVFDLLGARGVEQRSPDGSVCFGVWSCNTFFPLGCLDDRGSLVAPAVALPSSLDGPGPEGGEFGPDISPPDISPTES